MQQALDLRPTRATRSGATLLTATLVATFAATLAGCGNTVTNNEVTDAVVGPPRGAPVVVRHGDATTTYNLEGELEAIGENWVGVRRSDDSVLWVPANAVRSIEQRTSR